jgi:hypothetical protein
MSQRSADSNAPPDRLHALFTTMTCVSKGPPHRSPPSSSNKALVHFRPVDCHKGCVVVAKKERHQVEISKLRVR